MSLINTRRLGEIKNAHNETKTLLELRGLELKSTLEEFGDDFWLEFGRSRLDTSIDGLPVFVERAVQARYTDSIRYSYEIFSGQVDADKSSLAFLGGEVVIFPPAIQPLDSETRLAYLHDLVSAVDALKEADALTRTDG
ncbi:MAG: hypothetical protein AAB624_03125 [Patescibacteria group bacterium]